MIYLYTGTPGSGKSYHVAVNILWKIKRKQNNKVIANFPVSVIQQHNFIHMDTREMTPKKFIEFAHKNHVPYKEEQSLIIIDEAQLIFNSRDWNSRNSNRMEWIEFFSQHRKFGYNVILVTQDDRMIDRQIRSLVEYEISHMKIGNYFKFLPVTAFMCVTRWYGQKMKQGHEVIMYKKKVGKIYNTFATFEGAGGMGSPVATSNVANENEEISTIP